MTDDRGGKDTETKDVVATAPANHPFVSDAFSRTQASGLGTADIGGAWTSTGASGFAVGCGAGVWKLRPQARPAPPISGRRCGTAPT